MRLIVTAGAWGAGLCLVIGLVAMVAQSAAPRRPAHPGGTGDEITRPEAYVGLIRQFSGTGRAYRYFQVAGHSRWELRWSYRCRTGTRGYLTVSEPAINSGIRVQSAGAMGRGTAWAFSDATTHFLLIHGTCPWTVTVAGHH